jgi:hypothetical protein
MVLQRFRRNAKIMKNDSAKLILHTDCPYTDLVGVFLEQQIFRQ